MPKLPIARTENIIVQELSHEILIYDLNIDKAFVLNETSMLVYRACDGKTSFDELKRQTKFTDDLIYLALDELREYRLLATDYQSKLASISRREAIRRVGLASAVALPFVTATVAPRAAQAQSAPAPQCPPGSPNPGGLTNGQIAGAAITASCLDQVGNDALCEAAYPNVCCSSISTAADCREVAPLVFSYSCVCT